MEIVIFVHHQQFVNAEVLGEKFIGAGNRIFAEFFFGDGVNLLTRRVLCAGKEVRLTRKESELLEFLMRHPDHVHSPSAIAQELWNIEFDGHPNAVERHICSLRAKLGAAGQRIETLRGFGYRLAA